VLKQVVERATKRRQVQRGSVTQKPSVDQNGGGLRGVSWCRRGKSTNREESDVDARQRIVVSWAWQCFGIAEIGGVSLQRSIVWIPLERRTLDLLHLLHPDLEYRPATHGQGQPAREAGVAHRGNSPQGRPAPLAGAAARRGSTCKHGSDQPVGALVARGHTRLQHRARKGGQLQGARKGLPPVTNPAANRGDGADRRGGRPLAGWLPAGKGSHRAQGSSGDSNDADGARGFRASF
ncbi:hypothetical protein GW17_00057446, partial [Ensete ventricosum]